MEHFLEIIAPVSMLVTAGMLIWVNVLEIKQEREEAKRKEFEKKHEEIKRRWKEAGNK